MPKNVVLLFLVYVPGQGHSTLSGLFFLGGCCFQHPSKIIADLIICHHQPNICHCRPDRQSVIINGTICVFEIAGQAGNDNGFVGDDKCFG